MAINPNTQYPGKVATPDANYPYGGAQNITTPGDGTGTPWEAALLNDIFGMQQGLLSSSGIVPSGTPEKVGSSQYIQSLVEIASGRAFNYAASGTGNAIVLTANTNQESPQGLFTGLKVRFKASASNTGATTVNVAGLGIITIKLRNGADLAIGDISFNSIYTLEFTGIFFILDDSRRAQNVDIEDLLGYYTANDVEEALAELRPQVGTWTPEIKGGTTAGTGWTYSLQQGSYVRIGKMIWLSASVVITAIGAGAAGSIDLIGFPFVLDTTGKAVGSVGGIALVNLTTGYTMIHLSQQNSTELGFQESRGDVWNWLQISQLDMGPTASFQCNVVARLP